MTYMSSLRHIRDPVLSSLKMKGIRLLFSQLAAMTAFLNSNIVDCEKTAVVSVLIVR
jgi:hypothetical protein